MAIFYYLFFQETKNLSSDFMRNSFYQHLKSWKHFPVRLEVNASFSTRWVSSSSTLPLKVFFKLNEKKPFVVIKVLLELVMLWSHQKHAISDDRTFKIFFSRIRIDQNRTQFVDWTNTIWLLMHATPPENLLIHAVVLCVVFLNCHILDEFLHWNMDCEISWDYVDY